MLSMYSPQVMQAQSPILVPHVQVRYNQLPVALEGQQLNPSEQSALLKRVSALQIYVFGAWVAYLLSLH